MTQRCRDCNAEVLWVGTLKGKRQCLNAQPDIVHGDTFIAHAGGPNGSRLAIPASRLTDEARNEAFTQELRLYRSHFATCSARKAARAA